MAPAAASDAAPSSSFSLEDIASRIAQLRAQLRADADSGGGTDGSSISVAAATNAPSSSSRFSALVELGSLLATCSLPAYSAPVREESLRWVQLIGRGIASCEGVKREEKKGALSLDLNDHHRPIKRKQKNLSLPSQPAPFSGAYVPRSQDEEAALCLLIASEEGSDEVRAGVDEVEIERRKND